jgi:glycosyltransferase involved in cell wall biosynthesis
MKVCILVAGREIPSTRLRLREPARLWEREGIECRILEIPSGPIRRWGVLRETRTCDVVILQKKTSLNPWDLYQLSRANPRIVFDFDDAVMFHEIEHGLVLSGKHFRKFIRTVRHAQSVVAGNNFLARFARDAGCEVTVLPTPVDPGRYRAFSGESRPLRKDPVIGWLGVAQNQKYLDPLRQVFQSLARKIPGLRVKIVSERFPFDPGITVDRKSWRLEDEPYDIASFDVGIMPLPDNLWAWGKCGYKLIQYLASGIPVVASPVGLNLDIVQEGRNGYFAKTAEEWTEKLEILLSSPLLARELGENGRKDVERQYSIRAYAGEYIKVLRRGDNPASGGHGE